MRFWKTRTAKADFANTIITKIIFTASSIVAISEIGKINDKLGGLIPALPLFTIFVVCWMYYEGFSENKIAKIETMIEIIVSLIAIISPFGI